MTNTLSAELISARRELVLNAYKTEECNNNVKFLEGDIKSTSEYIYENQKDDANNIVMKFYNNNRYVISIQKKTKVGADGLMIEIAKLLTTHIDDNFIVNYANVRIITGMSNAGWEKDMIEKAPQCFKNKIFHHGKLSKSDIMNISNGLIIIDEIDTGDKEFQVLHTTLKEAGVLDVNHMKQHNNKFVFISATMIKELYDLYRWGDLHEQYKMTIPLSYFGHKDFLENGIIKEFYPLTSKENANKWIKEDIIDNYGNDFRIHIVRVSTKTIDNVHNACIRNEIIFKNHTSENRLTPDEIKEFFEEPLTKHIVLGVKGFFRRANLIPNKWKLRIGATHELHTKKVDNNVQVQGLSGRMTGYWRHDIENGHKTGPYRTSIKAIEEYEKIYNDPFGENTYETTGFKKKNGKTVTTNTMLTPKNIANLEPIEAWGAKTIHKKESNPIIILEINENQKERFDDGLHMLEILKMNNEEAYIKYNSYKRHCWKIDTPIKCEKYCVNMMMKPNAMSSETNIKERTKNILMIYLYENKLIFSPWSGEETIKKS